MWAHIATSPLVVDHTFTIVSASQARVRLSLAQPPQRSTRYSPSRTTATDPPTSPRFAKFFSNCSRTPSNPSAANPEIIAASCSMLVHPASVQAPINGSQKRDRACVLNEG